MAIGVLASPASTTNIVEHTPPREFVPSYGLTYGERFACNEHSLKLVGVQIFPPHESGRARVSNRHGQRSTSIMVATNPRK